MPIASAPQALPCAISARIRLVPSCAAVALTQPRASRTVMTSGLSFSSIDLASAASRILRAMSRVRSAMDRVLYGGSGDGLRDGAIEAKRQHLRDMQRIAAGAVGDLVPAAM